MNELLGALISAAVVLAGTVATTGLAISTQRSQHRRVEHIKRGYEVLDAARDADEAGSERDTLTALREYIHREAAMLSNERTIERTIERSPTRFWAVLLAISIVVSVVSLVAGVITYDQDTQPWLGISAALYGVWFLTWFAVPVSAVGLIVAKVRKSRDQKENAGDGVSPKPGE